MPEESTTRSVQNTVNVLSEEEYRARVAGRATFIAIIFIIIAIGSYAWLYLQTGAWQILGGIAGLVLGIVCLVPAHWLARRGKLEATGYWVLATLMAVYGIGELVWADVALPQTVSSLLLIVLIGSAFRPRRWGIWVVATGLYLAYVFLVNRFEPLRRYPITAEAPAIQLINVPLALAVLWQASQALRTLRLRLLFAFVTLVLVTAAVISTGSIVVSFQSGQQQAINQLESVAVFKETEINNWLDALQSSLTEALTAQQDTPLLAQMILQPGIMLSDPTLHLSLQGRFSQYIKRTQRFEGLFLLNLEGKAIVATDERLRNTLHSDQPYFQEGVKGFYTQSLFGSFDYAQDRSPLFDGTVVIAARPVVGEADAAHQADAVHPEGETLGVLVGYVSSEALSKLIVQQAGLGKTGEIYLVGSDQTLLTEASFGEPGLQLHTQGAEAAFPQETQTNGFGLYDNYEGRPVVGVYRWLPKLEVALLAEQEQTEVFEAVRRTMWLNVGLALGATLLAALASFVIAQSISRPLSELAQAATQVAAGELERTAKVERQDEIGTLAQAFNSMTTQLRGLIGSLEQRVAERTRDLEQRSAYLEASAEVGHAAASILDADELIRQVVDLIRERFNLYYVGLFLVDEAREWAVLRAGTGEAGRAMLARGHKIKIGAGMIGWSVAHAEPRVALARTASCGQRPAEEAGEDAVRLATTDPSAELRTGLPETRSEAAIPLRSRGQVLGALTVQSEQADAFDEDTIVILQIMADQVAVALVNAQLFKESQVALEAAQRAYGELSREAWARLLSGRPDLGYLCDLQGVHPVEDSWRPEMAKASQEGQIIQENSTVVIPVKLRDQVLGVVRLRKPDDREEWTGEEIELMKALTDQLGIALESAWLYHDTQRRAAHERLISEVTARMRESLDMDTMLQKAIREIGEALDITEVEVRMREVDKETSRELDKEVTS